MTPRDRKLHRIDILLRDEVDRPCGHRKCLHAECEECVAAFARADAKVEAMQTGESS
jgi:hypothetical protein